ncbi:radical SAM protein [archaeon]|jgi:molybdenum cofactor biosynthesis enzyme MoaA|nr:radical SAM protein [archaeon]MBT7128480.1 radical SAM protein [archaeon]
MKIQTLTIVAGSSACNARCPYCVSRMTPKQGIGLEEPVVNWRNFEKACNFSKMNDVSTVLITGKGEPTLFPEQISEFLNKLERFEFPFIEIQTNGIVLAGDDCDEYLKKWYDLGLTTIAISIVHYERDKNKLIFTPEGEYFDLEKLIAKLHDIGYTVRISCTLVKGFVDSKDEALALIKKVKGWGVEQLSLRKLAAPQGSECKSVYDWTMENMIGDENYSEIELFVKENGNQLLALAHGATVYDLEGQNVCLTSALTIEPERDNMRQVIFFPDGHLRYDWQYKGAILI